MNLSFLSFLYFPDSSEKAKKIAIEDGFPLGMFFPFSFDLSSNRFMEDEEIIACKTDDDQDKPESISLKERIDGVDHDGYEKKKMEESENPVKHRSR